MGLECGGLRRGERDLERVRSGRGGAFCEDSGSGAVAVALSSARGGEGEGMFASLLLRRRFRTQQRAREFGRRKKSSVGRVV